MERILMAVFLTVFATSTFAGDSNGFYIGLLAGKTSGVAKIDNTSMYNDDNNVPAMGLLFGYQFNRLVALEAEAFGLNDSTSVSISFSSSSGNNSSAAIAGGDIAGVMLLPLTESFSILARAGYATLANAKSTTTSSTVNNVTTSTTTSTVTSWNGTTYGLGMQYMFNQSSSRASFGIRGGVNLYNVDDSNGQTETPRLVYLSGLVKF